VDSVRLSFNNGGGNGGTIGVISDDGSTLVGTL
jgi:hypothetical protein